MQTNQTRCDLPPRCLRDYVLYFSHTKKKTLLSSLIKNAKAKQPAPSPNSSKQTRPPDADTMTMSRTHVDHTYRDYSRYLQEGGKVARHKKSDTNFPAKLHEILSTPEFSHIITWMVRTSFVVAFHPCVSHSSSASAHRTF